ncbi:hypothetical protein KKG81_10740 [bacterium]|nr:hypothetical protein [bacterium]
MKKEIFKFWINSMVYVGYIVGQNDTHWFVKDKKYSKPIELPKGNTVKISMEEFIEVSQ